tara:strand:- start:501 stop:842 length:342 start_codon:yes stop_codon:yes gene_type:complete
MSLQKHIKDLVFFYVKINYNQYLETNKITTIPEESIREVISLLYIERKEHLKEFIKSSLKEILKEKYPGDLIVLNICVDIFSDGDLCVNRLVTEIKLHQQKENGDNNDYSKLL